MELFTVGPNPIRIQFGLSLLVSLFLALGCTSRSSVDLPASVAATYTVTAVDAVPVASIWTNPQGYAYYTNPTLVIAGLCSRGIATIQVSVNGTIQPSQYFCALSGIVQFNYTAMGDGPYSFVMTPILIDGSSSGAVTTFLAYVQQSAPPPPIVNQTTVMAIGGGSVQLSGSFSTLASDGIGNIIVTGATGTTSLNLGAGTFTFTFNAINGNAYNLGFQTQNYAGNDSTSVPAQVFTKSLLTQMGFVGSAPNAVTSVNQLAGFSSTSVLLTPPNAAAISTNNLYIGNPAGAAETP